jgi:Leucine-rich repeat (LRR) protein
VDCDNVTGRVVGLSVFHDANLTGSLPDAIANLTHLERLVLHHLPGLTGGIPESLTELGNLTLLTISYTGMSGPVPSFLSRLTSLVALDLSYNAFTGAIPASLADIPSLTGINLSRNRLTGTIPPLLFSNVSSDEEGHAAYLWLSHNSLSGGVPAEFGAVSFAHVDLSRNAITGDPSAALFGREKTVQQLDLSRNRFSFSLTGAELPEQQLSLLDLSHNGIRGRIPEQVANLTKLQSFNVSYNKLCGEDHVQVRRLQLPAQQVPLRSAAGGMPQHELASVVAYLLIYLSHQHSMHTIESL